MNGSAHPWHDWVPGVLSAEQVSELIEVGGLKALSREEIGLSAVDLVVEAPAYEMNGGAVKPFGGDYAHFLDSSSQAKPLLFDRPVVLERRHTYVFKIKLEIGSRVVTAGRFHGRATGRSSIGRVDVLTRLIVNGMDQYESFGPEGLRRGSDGKLFLEVTPLTFNVWAKPGISLSQLRIFLGPPESALIRSNDICLTALRNADEKNDGYLSLQVEPEQICEGLKAVAFRSRPALDTTKTEPVRLWKPDDGSPLLQPRDYWEPITEDTFAFDGKKFVTISHGSFYILRSKEALAVPAGVAVYCRPSDETIGEMRIHYAGFVHPWFGRERGDSREGTPLIFEVRGHDFDVKLMHGEKLARLDFYRMSKDAVKPDEKSEYSEQTLKLSGLFGAWS